MNQYAHELLEDAEYEIGALTMIKRRRAYHHITTTFTYSEARAWIQDEGYRQLKAALTEYENGCYEHASEYAEGASIHLRYVHLLEQAGVVALPLPRESEQS